MPSIFLFVIGKAPIYSGGSRFSGNRRRDPAQCSMGLHHPQHNLLHLRGNHQRDANHGGCSSFNIHENLGLWDVDIHIGMYAFRYVETYVPYVEMTVEWPSVRPSLTNRSSRRCQSVLIEPMRKRQAHFRAASFGPHKPSFHPLRIPCGPSPPLGHF